MKELQDMKLGEIIEENMWEGILVPPNQLVRISYTFQDKNETQVEMSIKHKNFIEEDLEARDLEVESK